MGSPPLSVNEALADYFNVTCLVCPYFCLFYYEEKKIYKAQKMLIKIFKTEKM